jgi:hypothetical protein
MTISKKAKTLISVLVLLSCFILIVDKTYATVLFEDKFDNYDDNTFPTKWIEYISPSEPACVAQWKVLGGELNISIGQTGCSRHIIPSPSLLTPNLSSYILETNIRFNGGTDRHISFRMNPATNFFRTIHFFAPGDFGVDTDNPLTTFHLGRNYIYNHTYKFKFFVTNDSLKIYSGDPDGELELVHEVTHLNDLEQGTIGLGSSPGGGGGTETWFDNVRVTTIDHVDTEPEMGLSVPLIKQTDPTWGNDIYDSADLWATGATGLSRWGCALTSAVMVFHYNGLKKMADGTDITPGTANQWLKSQPDGYIRNGLLNWLALSRLSKQIKVINSATFDALEYERRNPDNAYLSDSIENKRIPAILAVPGHFIVARGVDHTNSTYTINDPFYDVLKLSDPFYGNNYQGMGIYTPSNTDLSYIMIVTNPDIDIELINSLGESVGEGKLEAPIDDAVGNVTNSKGPLKIFYLKKPGSGPYELNISSSTPGPYQLDQYFYDLNGQVKKISVAGTITAGKVDAYKISFDKNNAANNKSTKLSQASYVSVKAKIIEGYKAKKIKDGIVYLALLAELELSRKSSNKIVKKGYFRHYDSDNY